MDRNERIIKLEGQLAALGMAVQALLKHHPNRSAVAQTLHESYEHALSRALSRTFPDAFLDGMKSSMDVYLLKQPEDPGQPKRSSPKDQN